MQVNFTNEEYNYFDLDNNILFINGNKKISLSILEKFIEIDEEYKKSVGIHFFKNIKIAKDLYKSWKGIK